MSVRNFGGLLICAGVFCLLAYLNPWYAVSFVSGVIGLTLLAWICSDAIVHSTRRGWFKR
jgi:hypothetical protein